MPFLVPALVALTSDVLILVLNRSVTALETDEWIYKVTPLVYFCVIRMLALAFPILFHSYTGTALRFLVVYKVLYSVMFLWILWRIVVLGLLDPESLSTLWAPRSHLDFVKRSIWYILGLSMASWTSHIVLVLHVRSTAQQLRPRNFSTMYFAVRMATLLNRNPENEIFNNINEFVKSMQVRFRTARVEWSNRLEELSKRITVTTPFQVLLRLFAHEDVWENKQLDNIFDESSLCFYAPQLLSFLLHGALYDSPVLEDWILKKCSQNMYFAHRCFWFLRSWCLKVPALSRRSSGTSLSMDSGGLTPFLDEPAQQESPVYCRNNPHSPFPPEERAMIERLLMRVEECGEEAMRRVAGNGVSLSSSASPADLVHAAETGKIPVDPSNSCPSVQHYDAMVSQVFPSPVNGAFERTPQFLDALIFLAENLFQIPREERKEILRQQLKSLECEFLPSSAVYLPIGNHHHRVWRIVSEESIPISTKERVPCIVAMEVIDQDEPMVSGDVLSDRQLLHNWRNADRNPFRREGLLEKVVKVPFDKMKTQVQDQLNQFRDRTSSEGELPLVNSISIPVNAPATVPRTGSAGSLVSLGQWNSPPPPPSGPVQRRALTEPRDLDGIRTRLDGSVSRQQLSGSPLTYGSDQEEDQNANQEPTTEEETSNQNRPPPVVFREDWNTKQDRVRRKSAFATHAGWRLLPILIKANDDLRQEQLASQIIQRMAVILAREKVNVWLCPYEILALTDRGGIIEAIPDTISIDSLKKNSNLKSLQDYFDSHFHSKTELAAAKANFVESLAAYSMICYLLQIKDRHNGNILIDKLGHIIHIDFGFFFLSSPGKNAGFESAPFKLTRDFCEVLGGPDSHYFSIFRDLCVKTFLALRRHNLEIVVLVQMLTRGNEDLSCFRNNPDLAVDQLRKRFQLHLNDRACQEFVNVLVDESIGNWTTAFYDNYQRYFVGVL